MIIEILLTRIILSKIKMWAQKPEVCMMDTFFALKTSLNLKGYGCICFDLSLHLLSFWNSVNQGLIFKYCKFSNWHKSLSSKNFYWILGFMHPTITCKLKSSEKRFYLQSFIPKIMILPFLSQKFTHHWQVNSVCCKSSLYEQARI